MDDCVLFATLGQTDLQVIVPTAAGDGRRVSVAKTAMRAVHEYWLQNGGTFELPGGIHVPEREDEGAHAELGGDADRLVVVGGWFLHNLSRRAGATCANTPWAGRHRTDLQWPTTGEGRRAVHVE